MITGLSLIIVFLLFNCKRSLCRDTFTVKALNWRQDPHNVSEKSKVLNVIFNLTNDRCENDMIRMRKALR